MQREVVGAVLEENVAQSPGARGVAETTVVEGDGVHDISHGDAVAGEAHAPGERGGGVAPVDGKDHAVLAAADPVEDIVRVDGGVRDGLGVRVLGVENVGIRDVAVATVGELQQLEIATRGDGIAETAGPVAVEGVHAHAAADGVAERAVVVGDVVDEAAADRVAEVGVGRRDGVKHVLVGGAAVETVSVGHTAGGVATEEEGCHHLVGALTNPETDAVGGQVRHVTAGFVRAHVGAHIGILSGESQAQNNQKTG